MKKWKSVLAKDGLPGLAAKPQPPPPTKLNEAQRARLVQILIAGPLASGYATNLWTCPRVAELVQRQFGVSHHPDHLGRILHELGFTPQRPEQRARERDETAIASWRRRKWPRIKRGPPSGAKRSYFLLNPAFACSR